MRMFRMILVVVPAGMPFAVLLLRLASVQGFLPAATHRLAYVSRHTTEPRCLYQRQPALYRTWLRSSAEENFLQAQDLEALQALFAKYCDSEGLMTKTAVMQIPAIADLLAEGDLLMEELLDIWEKAPKFPDMKAAEERVDVDSFVQIYRDVDDLFEDDGDDNDEQDGTANLAAEQPEPSVVALPAGDASENDEETDSDESMEDELESIYESLCDESRLVSKETLRNWDEVATLLQDGLLDDDEFEDLWTKTKKSPGAPDSLDVDGFLSFNVALDGLFDLGEDFGEDDESDAEEDEESGEVDDTRVASAPLISGDDLEPEILFNALANANGMIGKDDLLRWAELKELLDERDILTSEFDEIFDKAAKGGNDLTMDGFNAFRESIDDLFEEDEEDEDAEPPQTAIAALKDELLEALDDLQDPELLLCGLDASEPEQKQILRIVSDMERQPTNLIRARQGRIAVEDLVGTWEMVYSSSSAMRFNKGLSGLGGSFPNGKFGGLKQTLKATKYMADVEYLEHIEVKPSSASFDVKVTGSWDLRTSVSLFTGEPSLTLTVEPDQVMYGPTSTRADHWKSLGPMNMLDVSYLDDDLRIMRGNTAVDTLFIFRRLT